MKLLKNSFIHIFSVLLLLIIATFPLVIFNMGDRVAINFEGIFEEMKQFFSGLFTGSSFYYEQGDRIRSILTDISRYFKFSFFYLFWSSSIILLLSFILGIYFWRQSNKLLNNFLGFLGMIPDFIFISILQILVVIFYQKTGVRLAKVATPSTEDPAILLPLITLVLIPLIYIVRTLNERTQDVLREDYILTAISKGIKKRNIYLYHVTTNVTPFLKADLHKILAIMISNLFIVEYLFNTGGITALLFQHQMKFGYQYNLVIFCFFALFLLYVLLFFYLKMLILLVERILRHD
ncbi:peptide/nickel transport system permease protein [Bacillus oleivorans]|uniref:Peptide/nickel transport system permease protein n=1 Tax=Bacillus oleivorans TaxID=1448271 RepID=A0A285D5H6_9BACI|nr:ABC transporter permease subunit [Bacillus oleivorans]SNX75029.1 peptide/nickel transport system permease protein [Bacillus oleivorans]